MNPIETIAISKAVKDAELKVALGSLAAGSAVPVDVTVRIQGTLTKGADTTKRATSNILSQAVLAKALVYAGVTADAFKVALRKAVQEAILEGKKVGEAVEDADARVVAAIAEVQAEVVATIPEVPVSGAVKLADAVVSVVNTNLAEVEAPVEVRVAA